MTAAGETDRADRDETNSEVLFFIMCINRFEMRSLEKEK